MILADTSGLLALFNGREPRHDDVRAALSGVSAPLVVSPYVVAELDYLVSARIGVSAEVAVLRELAGPGYELAAVNDALLTAVEVVNKYADPRVGVTDASIVALAQQYRTNRVLTLDQRHFGVLRTLAGEPFVMVP